MPNTSFTHSLAASVFVFLTLFAFPSEGAAQRSDAAEFRALAERLPPEMREQAESYLVSSDTAVRAYALRNLVDTNPRATDFVVAVLRQEPHPYVRHHAIIYMAQREVPRAHEGFRDLLVELTASDPDSLVAQRAYTELQQIRAHDDFNLIQERIRQARATGRAPYWLLRLEQITSDNRYGIVLPRFMREPPPAFDALPTNQPIRVLAFGDYGVGDDAQRKVAKAMRGYHAETPFDMGITLGDNFYNFPRPESPASPRWKSDFEDLYGAMGFPIYAALGNHDFDVPDQAAAEWVYSLRSESWNLPALYYTYTAGNAQFFVIDGMELTGEQLEWLDEELGKSTARWKIVYGHYPLRVALPEASRSYQDHLDEKAGKLFPIYRGRVDVHIGGHHHSLQHLEPQNGVHVLISGAAGRAGYPTDPDHPDALFASNQHGFLVLDIDRDMIGVTFVGDEGQILHEGEIRK